MYLKKIEIQGFKSFADKVTIDFKNGITGIVGPNGSGKSNIIDAVRWVLGEQSAKTLRGGKMEDVIFNGTEHRKPLGLAEVSLTFDNIANILPIDFSEVTISRRIYRSGESEYLLNKTPCRLKDIKELLMDTGIGIDGYSLIGQGQIDKILSNRPDERKLLFEEAAGIVKFKTRKEEAEKKLENTNQNLLRIEDIITELDSRIEPLREESLKAQNYLTLSSELKQLELNLFINEIEEIKVKLKSEEEQFRIVEEQIKNYTSEKDSITFELSNCNTTISNMNNEIQSLQQSYYETTNLLKKLEGEKVLFQEKILNTDRNYNRIAEEIEKLENNKKTMTSESDTLMKEKENFEKDFINNSKVLKEKEEKLQDITILLNAEESRVETSKSEIIEILNNISNLKSEINGLSALQENILKGINKIRDEENSLLNRESKNINEKEIFSKKINEINLHIDSLKKEKNDLHVKTELLTNDLKKETYVLDQTKDTIREIIAKRKLYEQMEKSYEGYSHSVKKTLELCDQNNALGEGVHGVVAQLMGLPKELEVAIEVALGYSMQYIICDNDTIAKKIIKHLKNNNIGRVTFFPLNNIYNKETEPLPYNLNKISGFIGKGNELISFPNRYEELFKYLLGRTLIVDNIDTATTIFKQVKTYKIVTLDGDIINPSGTITGGSHKSKTTNLLSRKRKIKEFDNEIFELNKAIDIHKEKIDKLNRLISSNTISFDNIINKINELKISLVNNENTVNNINIDLDNIRQGKKKLSEELKQINIDLNDINNSIEDKQRKIKDLDQINVVKRDQVTEESQNITNKQKDLEALQEEITLMKIKLTSLSEKRETNQNEIMRLMETIKEVDKNKDTKESELKSLIDERENHKVELNNIEINIKDNDILLKQVEYNIKKLNKDKRELEAKRNSIVEIEKNINSTLEDLKDSLHKIEVKKTRLELQNDTLIKKIWEKYELSYIDALNEKTEIGDLNEANKKMSYIKDEIKTIGDVNLNSIKEFEEVNERYNFLSSQKNDLINGRNSLKKVINELESTMEKQFLNSFNEINSNFTYIFNQLFNGGRANLLLEDDSNVLESNIEIIAQPPGKKLQNLNLLSGGEKALTAIALLFAILKTKPTPFCILDEIEAALDDVNIFRFAEFLKEFSKNSQFIIITHRKGTMEIIDYIYGVTMQEYGVSKIVSVKLTDVAI